jgi:stage III sporulation protein AA
MFDDVLKYLPEKDKQIAEEIRIRRGGGVSVILAGNARIELPSCKLSISEALARATQGSYHSVQESLRKGFVSAPGGIRVGVCGSAAVKDGEISGWKDISSVCIRLCRARKGIAREAGIAGSGKSTLIISPPGAGKTTLLRDLVRTASDAGYRVGLADERGEIAALSNGVPALDVGVNTDVIDGVPRAEAVMFLLRTMNPQIIATDEITDKSDYEALSQAANCGVALFATSHRSDADTRLFERIVRIRVRNGKRTYEVTEC